MNSAHKDILNNHRMDIVASLNVAHVKDSLLQNCVFDICIWEEIERAGKGTTRGEASALLDRLPTRGPKAFWCFCEALMTGGYVFLAEPLIEEAKQLPQKVPTRVLALFLSGQISSIKQGYKKIVKERGVSVMKALKKVGHATKTEGRKESEQRLTSMKHIKEALERSQFQKRYKLRQDQTNFSFDKSDESALINILDMVKKLSNIRNELQKDGSVPVTELNSMLADGVDFSGLYDMTLNRGIDFMKDLRKQGVDDSDIRNFGTVLVLIPYLCELAEGAAEMMRLPSLPTVEDVAGAVKVLKLRPYVPAVEDSSSSQGIKALCQRQRQEMGTRAGVDVEEEQDDINPWDQAASRFFDKEDGKELVRSTQPATQPANEGGRTRKLKRAFISYTMDPYNNSDPQQREADVQLQRSRVKSLADELRRNGVDCRLDQYVEYNPPYMWTTWMQDEIVQADYVLMVCSPHYLECVTGQKSEDATHGHNTSFEGRVIFGQLSSHDAMEKFLPVFFDEINRKYVPPALQGCHMYGPIEHPAKLGQKTFDILLYKMLGWVREDWGAPEIGKPPTPFRET